MFKALSFGEFTVRCGRNGVMLDGAIIDRVIASAQKPKSSPGAFLDPRHMIAATRTGARMRQSDPNHPLAADRVELSWFDDDFFARALGSLINNDGAPEGTTPVVLPSDGYRYAPNCNKSEPGFGAAIRKLAQDPGSADVQVIVDGDGKAVAMRKGGKFGAGTTLTFVATEAGIYTPPGSVTRVDVVGDTHDKQGAPIVTRAMDRIVPVDNVTSMTYLRPSAFAVPGNQRPEHFGPEPIELMSLTVGKIATMAQAAVDRLS